ncbi:MAG TPA: NAD-dependent epimerase/dehydratase family protein [Croceibacterium sp.]|jgi:UDP-2-acetamido-2,6-beta-L-arabino-hexul-4-ose reductase
MNSEVRTVTVTGANGFVGRNLSLRLKESGFDVVPVTRETAAAELQAAFARSDAVVHLAGANRPADPSDFMRINRDFTASVANAIARCARHPLVIAASSVRADEDSEYGSSKRAGERAMEALGDAATVSIWRLPNVFGKWARPNYNSVVATFCHNLARGLPLRIDDPAAPLTLLYVDDLIDQWMAMLAGGPVASRPVEPAGAYRTTVGDLAALLQDMAEGRAAGRIANVGGGFERALYATYVSYLAPDQFALPVVTHTDSRGSFSEFMRTPGCGQVSILTAHPGETRGGHYHHTKVEKFLVVRGQARLRFRHLLSNETVEVIATADQPTAIETVPGWAHDITNIGGDELVALLWASETFDPARPDTVASPL